MLFYAQGELNKIIGMAVAQDLGFFRPNQPVSCELANTLEQTVAGIFSWRVFHGHH